MIDRARKLLLISNSTLFGGGYLDHAEQAIENATPVIGLREGTMLRVENGLVSLRGVAAARVFRHNHEPVEVPPRGDLAALLGV